MIVRESADGLMCVCVCVCAAMGMGKGGRVSGTFSTTFGGLGGGGDDPDASLASLSPAHIVATVCFVHTLSLSCAHAHTQINTHSLSFSLVALAHGHANACNI